MGFKISIVGTGNMARCLCEQFTKAGHSIHEIFGRNEIETQELAKRYAAFIVQNLGELDEKVDFIILAVSDSAIAEVAEALPETSAIVVHCSGSLDIEILSHKRSKFYGVFWPIQSISGPPFTDLLQVPIAVEGNAGETEKMLLALADSVSNRTFTAGSSERRKLHLAAVFINNFGNALYHAAFQIVNETGQKPEIFKPLMLETMRKALEFSPEKSQTGPAKRGDDITMEMHLEMLGNKPEVKEVYKVLSEYIKLMKS